MRAAVQSRQYNDELIVSNDDTQLRSKQIAGYENYLIFSDGRVQNIKTRRFLKHISDKNNYKLVNLYKNNQMKKKYIHRLLAQAFISNPENKSQINHINNNPADNQLENLEWSTQLENIQHAAKQKRMWFTQEKNKGIDHPMSKLTNQEVKFIRSSCLSSLHLSLLLSVSISTISNIKNNKRWSHVAA